MKRIVLLGANGQLGTDIRRVFRDAPVDLVPLYRGDIDVEQTERIGGVLRGIGPYDALINCTSYHKTDECEDYAAKAFAVNTLAPREMAEACGEAKAVLVHITTDYVFDGRKRTPYLEEDATSPLNAYGVSKAAGEHFVAAHHDKFFILRVSSLFGTAGASGKGGNFVETMLRVAAGGAPLRVVNDQIMSPTHTLDIAESIKMLLMEGVDDYGIYHCSGEGECSWHDFAAEIFRQRGVVADLRPVTCSEFPTKARRPAYSVLDNGKLNRLRPMPHWSDALRDYFRLKDEGGQQRG
ncbi:dTDP-4-dehydrorhamnose reductase [Paenibacillus hemerocallicola]|uniref:dTDP-4-dehydrorhamnose reductase n=1 Tax=Paenibacillus hemerocallicola TaxID=1172614 RepID=A0A5C4SZM7_9BACL|nr:dTDP-4-dehydrorhamnose reductase [Paenibacillus hemerocallicola]TNJ60642.1 dTDP-4-dehydrorhamnose reductase [Paenibacillus hemerocallicola]